MNLLPSRGSSFSHAMKVSDVPMPPPLLCPCGTMARLLNFSVDELLAVAGQLQCQHKMVPGMPLEEVWKSANEILAAAARSRPAEDAHQLLAAKAYAKTLLAAQELASVMNQVAPETRPLWVTRSKPQRHPVPRSTSLEHLALVPAPSTSAPSLKPRVTRDGHCHRPNNQCSTSKAVAVDGVIVEYKQTVWQQVRSSWLGWCISWTFASFPVVSQMVTCACFCMILYLASRPKLLARCLLFLLDKLWTLMWTSGGDLLSEFDAFVLMKFSWFLGPRFAAPNDSSLQLVPSHDETVLRVAEHFQADGANTSMVQAAVMGASMAMARVEDSVGKAVNSQNLLNSHGFGPAANAVHTDGSGLMAAFLAIIATVKAGKVLGI